VDLKDLKRQMATYVQTWRQKQHVHCLRDVRCVHAIVIGHLQVVGLQVEQIVDQLSR